MSRFTEHFDINLSPSSASLVSEEPPASPTSTLSSTLSASSDDPAASHTKKMAKVKRFLTGTIRRTSPNGRSSSLFVF